MLRWLRLLSLVESRLHLPIDLVPSLPSHSLTNAKPVVDNRPLHYAKLFGRSDTKHDGYISKPSIESHDERHTLSHYEKNRKLLAKIFIVWSVVLMLLLLHVLEVF